MTATASASRRLPLFPLGTVLFPGGLLNLKVFEARYLDLMSACLRDQTSFGVVAIRAGAEVRAASEGPPVLESVGCEASLLSVDAPQPGLMLVRCRGVERFRLLRHEPGPNGLLIGEVEDLEADPPNAVPQSTHVDAAKGLAGALKQLRDRGMEVALEPFRFQESGWIANRWSELLPLPLAAKQQLLELTNPALRLDLIDQFLKRHQIIEPGA